MAVSYYESGKVMARGFYFELKKDSLWMYYGENDSLKAVERYKAGILRRNMESVLRNSPLAEEKSYVNGNGRP